MSSFGQIHAGPGLILLIAAGVTLYIASRSAADALAGGKIAAPGRMALGHWIPIAAVAMGAIVLGRSEIALGVIFATSVASLSLALGSVTFLAPPDVPPMARRSWPMVLPAALLAFLAGLRGELTRWHAATFFIQGLAVWALWNDPERDAEIEREPETTDQPARARWRFSPIRLLQFLLASAVAVIGAWCAIRGADVGSEATRVYTEVRVASAGLVAATLLGPLLVLPMLGTGVDLAHRGQSWLAVSSLVGVVLLNLCLLLPAVVIEGQYHPLRLVLRQIVAQAGDRYAAGWSPGVPASTASPTTGPPTIAVSSPTTASTAPLATTRPSPPFNAARDEYDEEPLAEDTAGKPIPLPLAVWRVDIVVLIALGLFLMPVALGRWPLTKWEGLGLIGGYIAYLLLAMALGVRLV